MIKVTDKRSKWRIYKMFKLFKINDRLIVCYHRGFKTFVNEFSNKLLDIIKTIGLILFAPFGILYFILELIWILFSTLIPSIVYFNGSEEDLNYDYEKAQKDRMETTRNNLESLKENRND